MPFIEVDEGKLYYDVQGEGPVLVFLHGAWASHEWWRWQVPHFSKNYRVVLPDARGHGRSSDFLKGYAVDHFIHDLECIIEEVGHEEAVLIGWSMGGIIAMEYGLRHVSKVKGLVLISTRGHRNPAMRPRILIQYFRSILNLLMDMSAPRKFDRTGATLAEGNKRKIQREVERMLSPKAPQDVNDWLVTELVRNPRRNYLEVARSLWDWEIGESLDNIQIPTLILVGEKDRWTPPRFSQRLHDMMPHSKLVEFESAGHWVAMEQHDRVNSEIEAFLSSLKYT